MISRPILLTTLCAALAACASVSAAEGPRSTPKSWPMFHGDPKLSGIAPVALTEDLELDWSFEGDDAFYASTVIADGTVYAASMLGSVYAIDLETGEESWSVNFDGVEFESTPLILGDSLYIGASDGYLRCLNRTDGSERWTFETYDQITASPNWAKDPKDPDRFFILVGGHDAYLYCIDAKTGEKVWEYESGSYINGTAAVSGGLTAFGGCDSVLHVVDVTSGEQSKVVEIGAIVFAAIALDEGKAYYGHYENEFHAVDLESGEILWKYADRSFPFCATPAVTEEVLIVGSRDKRVHCLDRETGEVVWRVPTRGRVDSSPVVTGDRVVFGSNDGFIHMVDLKTGERVWSYETEAEVMASASVVEGRLVIASADGRVYAFTQNQ